MPACGQASALKTLFQRLLLIPVPPGAISFCGPRLPCCKPRADSILPLNGTSHRRHLMFRSMAGFGYLLHCFEQVTRSGGDERGARGIEATSILQFVLRVETKEIGCALSTIGASDFLHRIDHVWEDKAVPRGECLHVVERVLRIGLGIIWHDRNCADSDLA